MKAKMVIQYSCGGCRYIQGPLNIAMDKYVCHYSVYREKVGLDIPEWCQLPDAPTGGPFLTRSDRVIGEPIEGRP